MSSPSKTTCAPSGFERERALLVPALAQRLRGPMLEPQILVETRDGGQRRGRRRLASSHAATLLYASLALFSTRARYTVDRAPGRRLRRRTR